MNAQRDLFGASSRAIDPPNFPDSLRALAASLPATLRFGTMSWTYPGWAGHVYRVKTPMKRLVDDGLTAYSKHPLLRVVEIDRTYYEPVDAKIFADYAAQTPEDFLFVAKAHDECTFRRFPAHARFGGKRGTSNPRFLDPKYAAEFSVAPFVEGLGKKAGALLFQFAPQELGEPHAFADRLHEFLVKLPKGPTYCVELRNSTHFTSAYAAALADAGAHHCHNAWSAMPSVLEQAKKIPPSARRPLIIRWLLRPGDTHAESEGRYEPFDRLREEDRQTRGEVAELIAKASRHEVPVFALVDNKAEGCGPESIVQLANAIASQMKV